MTRKREHTTLREPSLEIWTGRPLIRGVAPHMRNQAAFLTLGEEPEVAPPAPSFASNRSAGSEAEEAMRDALILAIAIFLLAMVTAAVLVHFIVP